MQIFELISNLFNPLTAKSTGGKFAEVFTRLLLAAWAIVVIIIFGTILLTTFRYYGGW